MGEGEETPAGVERTGSRRTRHASSPRDDDSASCQGSDQEASSPKRGRVARSTAKPVRACDGGSRPGAARKARPLTETRIRNIAEAYVGDRECSRQMLRDVLVRRLDRFLRGGATEDATSERSRVLPLIEAEIDRLVGAGLIDDARFAEMKARSGLSAGRGARRILTDLRQKGITDSLAEDALREASREVTGTLGRDDVDDDEVCRSAEWEAAETFARKKRFGPWRLSPMPECPREAAKTWRREASSMARRGFSLDLIRQVLDREPEEDQDPL